MNSRSLKLIVAGIILLILLLVPAVAALTLTSYMTSTDGTQIILRFDQTMTVPGAAAEYTVMLDSAPDTVESTSAVGNMIVLTLTNAVPYGDATATVAYTGTDAKDTNGDSVASFSAQPVFNDETLGASPTPTITSPIYAGTNVVVSGTTVAGATVTFTDTTSSYADVATVTGTSWTITVPTLTAGDALSVTAQVPGESASPAATATVTAALPPASNPLVINSDSPVEMTVTAPNGLVISTTQNQIPGATYIQSGKDSYGFPDGAITIPNPIPGTYQVTITPMAGAAPNDVYTLTSTQKGVTLTLAASVPVSAIPAAGYGIQETNNGGIVSNPVPVAPIVTSVAPATGLTTGGTTVTITGTGFTGATKIAFGSVSIPASSFTINRDTSITVNSPPEAAGTVDITVTTAGGTSMTSSADQFTYQLQSSTTMVSSSENPSTLGDTVTFTATVTPSTATGTIDFVIDGTDEGPVTLSGGTATYSTSDLAVGTHTVEADYNGDANDLSSSGVLSSVQTVNQIQSSTSVESSENPSTLGDTVTFTATVTPSTATGSVQFLIDGSPFGTPVTISGGTATSGSISTLAVGTHTVGADYSGDTNDTASIGTLSPVQTVDPLTTSATVSSSLNPSTYGQTVAFTATVTPSTATGSVQFLIDGSPFGTPVTISGGTATSGSISTLIGGTHTIEVDYSGDTNDAASSGTMIQTVNPVSTSTGLSSSKNPSTYGDTVTFTAKVKPTTATGTVQFKIDGSLFGSAVTLSSGIATSGGISTLTGGTHTIEADYSGDTNDAASSWTISQTVKKASSAIIVSSSPNPSVYGQPVTFTATVTPSTATGTVTFKDGKSTLGTGSITGGTATFTTSIPLKVGSQSITAVYGGDTNYAKSTSSAITQAVDQASTTTSVTSSLNPSAYGKPVILTATISVTAPATGTPTGTVTFFDGSTNLGTAPVSRPKITVKTLAVGSHSITAVYNGNANFVASTSSVLTETVNLAPTTVTLKSSLNPARSGKSVTFTATVRPKSATGTVTFMDGSTPLGIETLASGVVKYTTSSLSVGSHAITAIYSGDPNYGTSTSIVLTQTITA
jgi:hypothetical protein